MTMRMMQMRWMTAAVSGVGAAALLAVVSAQQPPAPPQQPSEVAVVISGDPGTPPRYAVPDFVALTPDAAEIAKTLGQVLWDDLAFEREFYLIPRDTYSTIPAARTAEQIAFDSWRELGADAVVFGTVQQTRSSCGTRLRSAMPSCIQAWLDSSALAAMVFSSPSIVGGVALRN